MIKRRFGSIRRLPSGRWQARYRGEDGLMRPAPITFERRADADRWLAQEELLIANGDWVNPDAGLVALSDYATRWVKERANLRPKTRQLYEGLVRRHINPTLGAMPLVDLSPARIRSWRADLIEAGVSPTTTAKAYRLLRTVLATAVEDRLLRDNPCRIRGASAERPPERPTLTVEQVFALADGMPARYRALVMLGTFASMRFGELAALQRQHLDVDTGMIDIRVAQVELGTGELVTGPPKTAAGRRVVAVPTQLLPDLRRHLESFVGPSPTDLVFAGPKGAPLRRSNFQKAWQQGLEAAGLTGVHFHDLRHTGNTLAAQAGATMSDLMARMGHASTRAAQIYLHTTSQRDRVVADALDNMLTARSGTRVAREPVGASRVDLGNDEGPEIRGLQRGAGDGNRTRTVSLGS
ncbi:MAG: tyrosine-type recombinase/integrase [Jatrophihabitans sp.]|uniref:tyrosine-type recombinase/integrase n=1 Tax=Jatrophihabitans sp. TaxID=1932789 RepID=UPI003F7EDF4D